MTGRLVAIVAVGMIGCVGSSGSEDRTQRGGAPAIAEAPVPRDTIYVCVINNGELKVVTALRDPLTGDTLVDGRRLGEAHPTTLPPYARDAAWLGKEIIEVRGRYYAPYGPPRFVESELLIRAGEFRGVPLYAESALAETGQGAIFVPIRPGCEFQPYVASVDFM